MKRDRSEPADVEPHVFDQTNGVVDLGDDGSGRPDRGDVRNPTVGGFAVLSTQKP